MSQPGSQRTVVLSGLFLALFAYGAAMVATPFTQSLVGSRMGLRWTLIAGELALAAPALLAMWLLVRAMPELVRFQPLGRSGPPRIVALGLAFWALSLGVFEAQYVLVKPPIEYLKQFQKFHEALRPRDPLDWVFSILAIAIAPAVCEEILFRGLITPVVRRAAGSTLAILISAALFGLIHVDPMPDGTRLFYRVPFAFILGALLAKLRLDTGSLWPSMIAHGTLNATTFLAVPLMDAPSDVLPDPQPLMALAMLAVGSAIARLLMRQLRLAPTPPSAS